MIISKEEAIELGQALIDAAEQNANKTCICRTDEGSLFACELIEDGHDQGFETVAVILKEYQ